MAAELFAKHEGRLRKAVDALGGGTRWSPFPESPRAYDETAPAAGEERFTARLGRPFELDQPSRSVGRTAERSPYGIDLDVEYPIADADVIMAAAREALPEWAQAEADVRVGVCLEILDRLSEHSFEIAHAVMQTTGQPFLMAFQTGGPHALDRGLEAVARSHVALGRVPGPTRWEAAGKREAGTLERSWRVRPRGVAVTLGASTFPTWHCYPGLFASLATGNVAIVKPHPASVLPLAIVVETARRVLDDAGFDPDVVLLAVDTPHDPIAERLVTHPAAAVVDYTGGCDFGRWIKRNVTQAEVFTEARGVNPVIVDSVDDLKGTIRSLASLASTYSGQMCTTPHVVLMPRDGIDAAGARVPFDEAARSLAAAVEGLLADDRRASDVLGAIRNDSILVQIDAAAEAGEVLLASRTVANPTFPGATVRTPVVVAVGAADRGAYLREVSGPVLFVVATDSTAHSLEVAGEAARSLGALAWLVYTTDDEVAASAEQAALDAGVSIALNLAGGFSSSQAAALGDFHPTGANPTGNASLIDPGFVTRRFHMVGVLHSG